MWLATFVFTVLGIGAYLLPAIVAISRKHQNAGAVMTLNLFLGWSILGWVIALVWACTNKTNNVKSDRKN